MVGPIYLTKDFGAADTEGSMYLCTTMLPYAVQSSKIREEMIVRMFTVSK